LHELDESSVELKSSQHNDHGHTKHKLYPSLTAGKIVCTSSKTWCINTCQTYKLNTRKKPNRNTLKGTYTSQKRGKLPLNMLNYQH